MTAYQQALTSLLSTLGPDVYLAGQTPANAPFPYMSVTLAAAPFGGRASLSAGAWFLGRRGVTERAAFCDRLRASIPEGGYLLSFAGGSALITRAEGEYLSLVTDATEPRALGVRIRLNVQFYDL